MGYNRVEWVNGLAPAINEANLKNFNTGIEQNNLFNLLLTAGRYKDTIFDSPVLGDITEEIRLTADNSLYATLTTQFDLPLVGNITVTLQCTDLGIHNKVVTVFEPVMGVDIRETGSEV